MSSLGPQTSPGWGLYSPHLTASSSPLSLTPPPTHHTHTHLFEEVVFCVLQMSFYLNDLLASAFAKNLISDYPGLLTVMHVCVFILMYMYIPMSSEKSVVFTHNSSNWRWCHHTVVRFEKDGPGRSGDFSDTLSTTVMLENLTPHFYLLSHLMLQETNI